MVYSFSGFPPAENAFILSNLKCKFKRRTLKILSSISFVLGRFVEVGKNPAVKLVASAAMLLIHVHTHTHTHTAIERRKRYIVRRSTSWRLDNDHMEARLSS